MIRSSIFLVLMVFSIFVRAEDGSRLWLRYDPLPTEQAARVNESILHIHADLTRPSLAAGVEELQKAIFGFTGRNVLHNTRLQNRSVVMVVGGTRLASRLGLDAELQNMHRDGFLIRPMVRNRQSYLVIASPTQVGVLYGVFHLIRSIQIDEFSAQLTVKSEPKFDVRILNHWDNLNSTVERGYAGRSLWLWDELPGTLSPRYKEYARANASIGINAMTPNNVNADPLILSRDYLYKVLALANVFRPYGVRMYLSINFASPMVLDGLPTADPLVPEVRQWWIDKVNEIYKLIPDFGGFLVKANSEGQPGPLDFGRTHVDGANMIAKALKPHGGIVMWRAFVYEPDGIDRAKEAYLEFVPYDGQYHPNVTIQAKSGPVDFQPREPFSPIFNGLRKTAVTVEVQITQEYTGWSDHLVYLGLQNTEMLKSETYAFGPGSTVARMTDGTLIPGRISAFAGVANIGRDANWTGHHFAQSNWYAFGRQAWDHELCPEKIADEWIRMTFTSDPAFREPVREMMMSSLETVIDYMMPLGLHHLFAWTHHYGPEPWCYVPGARPDWLPRYYHQVSEKGIGFNRTRAGSAAVDQYEQPLADRFNDIETTPEIFLLWFHHVPWDHKMKSGKTLWDEMAHIYQRGVDSVRSFQKTWDRMEPFVDAERFHHIQSRLRTQIRSAVWWRDAVLLYFQTYSRMPIPHHLERPINDLEYYKQIKLPYLHHN
jgi:alpha-glucuronidase